MKFVSYFKQFGYNLQYLLQTNKCKVLRFYLRLQGLILDLKVLIFELEVRSSGSKVQFGCLFSSHGNFKCFLLVKRQSLDLKVWSFRGWGYISVLVLLPRYSDVSFLLKENALTWGFTLRGWGYVYMLVLFTRDLQMSIISLKEKVLFLEAFLLGNVWLDRKWFFQKIDCKYLLSFLHFLCVNLRFLQLFSTGNEGSSFSFWEASELSEEND